MKYLLLLSALLLLTTSCTKKADATLAPDWMPENASVAKHITSVHGFVIEPGEKSHLKVEKGEKNITATFRDDVFETLGGEKALYILGWEANPQEMSRHEYLYFLEALHAFLVMNHPQWDGGEGS